MLDKNKKRYGTRDTGVRYSLKASIMVSCFLVLTAGSGWAFVTPEHYEKIKQEARGKQPPEEKVRPAAPPGTFQVHPPAESKPAPGGFRKKN